MLWAIRRAALRRPLLWIVMAALLLTSQSFAGTYAWCLVADSSVHIASAFGPCPGHAAHGDGSEPVHPDHTGAEPTSPEAAWSEGMAHYCAGQVAGRHHGLHVGASSLVTGSVLHGAPPPAQRFRPVLLREPDARPEAAAAGTLRAARHAAARLPHRRIAGAMPGADFRLLI